MNYRLPGMIQRAGIRMEKPTLRFHNNGHFRILEVSDFHAGPNCNPKLTKGLDVLIETTKPDFIMIAGDQCLAQTDVCEARAYFSNIIEPIIRRNIPFGTIFGNHDREFPMPLEDQMKVFEGIPGCMSEAGPSDIHGIGNYFIPILSSRDDSPAYCIWAMDSNRYINDYSELFGTRQKFEKKDYVLPVHWNEGENGATVLFNQVQWYYNNSVALENR